MALDGDRLGLAIYNAIQAIKPDPADKPMDEDDEKAIWKAVGNQIVTEIITNAQVPATGSTVVASGSSAGTWPTTTTGTVT